MNARAGTGHWKAPELLLSYHPYDYAVDVWAIGAIFAGMLFDRKVFFKRSTDSDFDTADQLAILAETLGT